jgi:hypothetical protein
MQQGRRGRQANRFAELIVFPARGTGGRLGELSASSARHARSDLEKGAYSVAWSDHFTKKLCNVWRLGRGRVWLLRAGLQRLQARVAPSAID